MHESQRQLSKCLSRKQKPTALSHSLELTQEKIQLVILHNIEQNYAKGRSGGGEIPHSAAVCADLDLHGKILAPLSSIHTTVSSVYMCTII